MTRFPRLVRAGARTDGQIKGQVVAITGAGRGIGAAIARDLARRGARVALGDLEAAQAATLAAELGPHTVGLPLDVTDPASYTAFLDAAERTLGPLDVLVANAGVMWVGPFDEEPDDVSRRQFDVNVHGVIRGMKLAAPGMRARGRGHLVTIASVASKLSPRGEAAYAATKHAVYGYACAVEAELHGTGVAVSLVMPAVVETELAAGTSHGVVRRLTPEDVAAGVHRALVTRRRDLYIPRKVSLLTRSLALLPSGPSAALGRLVIPNQLTETDRTRRRTYEEHL